MILPRSFVRTIEITFGEGGRLFFLPLPGLVDASAFRDWGVEEAAYLWSSVPLLLRPAANLCEQQARSRASTGGDWHMPCLRPCCLRRKSAIGETQLSTPESSPTR